MIDKLDSATIEAIERATNEALAEIGALRELLADREARLERLRNVCDERQTVIDTLQQACDERLALIERLSAEAAAARANIEATHDGVDWRAIAIEREAALERVSAEAERRSGLLADLTAALHDRTQEVEELRRGRASAS